MGEASDSDRQIEPEFFEELGRIVVIWSTIEALLAEFLSYLIPADSGGMYVLNQSVSSEMKLKWIKSLCEVRIHDLDLENFISELLADIDDLREERNGYIHGIWGTVDCPAGSILVQTVSLNRANVIREQLVTLADFDDLISRLDSAHSRLLDLGRRLGFGPR